MFQLIKHSTVTRYLCGLMALYLLNISVDTVDAYPNRAAEDLSFNDQESIVEIVVEKVLGFEDAIEEHDDPDTENHTKKNNFKIDFVPIVLYEPENKKFNTAILKQKYSHQNSGLLSGYNQLYTPPPEV